MEVGEEMGNTMFHVVNALYKGASLRDYRLRQVTLRDGWMLGNGEDG